MAEGIEAGRLQPLKKDPFEEIRIAPRGNRGQEVSVAGQGTEEVLIEGASVGSEVEGDSARETSSHGS